MKLIIFAIILIALGVILAYTSVAKALRCKEETIGTIIGVGRRSHRRNRGGRRVEYHPIFEYTVNGVRIQGTADNGSAFRNKFKEGTEMELRYNAAKPEEFVIKSKAFLNSNVVWGVILALFGIAGLIVNLVK